MKQVIQNMRTGQTFLEEVPIPKVKDHHILIQTTRSLISLGTERMLVDFGKANLISKALQQPEKVRQVLTKARTEGILSTISAVKNKLDTPLPLGYCNVGTVIEVGRGVKEFKVGDRVTSNGPHAEFVCVSKNLAAKIPSNVTDEEAAFTVIGSVALQGVRLLEPTFGEQVVIIGLGLVGLLTAQILKANGCRVIGFDLDEHKIQLAKSFGIDAQQSTNSFGTVEYVSSETMGTGCDGVIIAASTKNNSIISEAAQMCRKRGRIVLVGVTGLNLNRNDFYEKELTFNVSCSYGPGRYDSLYEDEGIDYPIGFVRWTEKRNFQALLSAIENGSLTLEPLISERHPLSEVVAAYQELSQSNSIATIIEYPKTSELKRTVILSSRDQRPTSIKKAAIIGTGNFTKATLLPSLLPDQVEQIKYLVSEKGMSATTLAKKYKISHVSTDLHEVLKDDEVDLLIISTRHNLHAEMVLAGLEYGKNVFVEKPLCLNEMELSKIIASYQQNGRMVTVGFNRRFSSIAKKVKSFLGAGPKNITATMNAGFIPYDNWVHDINVGGGRIIGEACHFIDLCSFFTGSKVIDVCANCIESEGPQTADNVSILLKYEDGSNSSIHYFANGAKSYPKERVEIFYQQKTFVIDNWRSLHAYGVKGFTSMKTKQDKGHAKQFQQLFNDPSALIPFDEIVNTSRAAFSVLDSIENQNWSKV